MTHAAGRLGCTDLCSQLCPVVTRSLQRVPHHGRARARSGSSWHTPWPREGPLAVVAPPASPTLADFSTWQCLNVPPSYGGVSTCGPCVDGPHFASLCICPRILGSLSCHLEILNLVTSARSLQHCEAIGSQVLGIRAWTLLGAKSSLPPCPVTPLACTSWARSLWGWVSFLSSGGHYGSAVVTLCGRDVPGNETAGRGAVPGRLSEPGRPSACCRGKEGFSDHGGPPKLGVLSSPLFQPGGRAMEAYSGLPFPLTFPDVY